MYVSNNGGIAFASKYKVCSLSEYEQMQQGTPIAEISSYVTAQCRGRLKDMYRKKRYPASIVFFVIAAAIIGYGVYLGNASKSENDAYFAVIAACVPLAIGIGILIKSYFSSGRFLVKLNTADGSDGHINYVYSFYDEEFICHYTLMDSFFVNSVMVIPYSRIRKILIADDALVLTDKQDVGFYIMKKDMPLNFEQRLCGLCTSAKVIDRRTM